MPNSSRLPPFVIYLTPAVKSVYMRAADHAHKSLSQHVRDLLANDVELRADQNEPYFASLRDELREALAVDQRERLEAKDNRQRKATAVAAERKLVGKSEIRTSNDSERESGQAQ